MPNTKFDIDSFVSRMTSLASEIEQEVKDFIAIKIAYFSRLGYDAIENNSELSLSAYEKHLLLKLIAETVFYKTVDFSISKIPSEYWESILQRLAFYIFELSKLYKKAKCDFEEAIFFINWRTEKIYKETLQELFNKNIISVETLDNALSQSYNESISEDTNIKLVQALINNEQYDEVAEFVVSRDILHFEIETLLEDRKISEECYNKLIENPEYKKIKEKYDKEYQENLEELRKKINNPFLIFWEWIGINLVYPIIRFINKFKKK